MTNKPSAGTDTHSLKHTEGMSLHLHCGPFLFFIFHVLVCRNEISLFFFTRFLRNEPPRKHLSRGLGDQHFSSSSLVLFIPVGTSGPHQRKQVGSRQVLLHGVQIVPVQQHLGRPLLSHACSPPPHSEMLSRTRQSPTQAGPAHPQAVE